MEQNCGNCRFWDDFRAFEEGECRRYPPRLPALESQARVSGTELHGLFPVTVRSVWCGEWAKSEEGALRECPQCSKDFRGRADKQYCSTQCRTKAFHSRKEGPHDGKRLPLPDNLPDPHKAGPRDVPTA